MDDTSFDKQVYNRAYYESLGEETREKYRLARRQKRKALALAKAGTDEEQEKVGVKWRKYDEEWEKRRAVDFESVRRERDELREKVSALEEDVKQLKRRLRELQ